MTKEETKQENIKISVENYGPIAKAKNIEIFPLTIFAGPSNTGKSYLAILIYSLFNTLLLRKNPAFYRSVMKFSDDEKMPEFGAEVLKSIGNDENDSVMFSSLPENTRKWLENTLLKTIKEEIWRDISRCAGTSVEDLSNKDFKLSFDDAVKRIHLEQPSGNVSMRIKPSQLNIETGYSQYDYFANIVRETLRLPTIPKEKEVFTIGCLLGYLHSALFENAGRKNAFYLPAARAFIMQSYKVIIGTLAQRAAYADSESLSIPAMNGVAADFLQKLIYINEGRKVYREPGENKIPIKRVARHIEDKILGGTIELETGRESRDPIFSYQRGGIKLPLLQSSSMVSKLAPIVLFLRNYVSEGDLFIVEEPEAHLHPGTQGKIAETLVRLVNEGVRVVITTHSDYILEKISNCVRRSALGEGNKNAPSIKEEEVGIYSFKPGRKGTVVKKLPFDEQSGLSPADHDKAASDIYNERGDILNRLESRKSA